MAMNAANVIIPGRGAIFTAEALTAFPDYTTMTPETPGAGWVSMGHTSMENAVSLSKEGGEVTTFDSWWTAALAVIYGSNSWTVTVNALQMDAGTLDLAFSGELDATNGGYVVPANIVAVEKALFILAMQGTKRMGLYLPKVSITLGDAPTFDPSRLFEIPLSAAVLADDNTLMQWFHPALDVVV
jgi:hypothetical protein